MQNFVISDLCGMTSLNTEVLSSGPARYSLFTNCWKVEVWTPPVQWQFLRGHTVISSTRSVSLLLGLGRCLLPDGGDG